MRTCVVHSSFLRLWLCLCHLSPPMVTIPPEIEGTPNIKNRHTKGGRRDLTFSGGGAKFAQI